jgi:cell division septation protein DedD
MKNVLIYLTIITLLSFVSVFSQTIDLDVEKYIKMIEQGDTEKAINESSNLISANTNNPGILYLQGKLSADGTEALKYYQTILDNFPKSQWADDALYYTYQYYYAIGLYRTAGIKLDQLKKQYPDSPYLNLKSSEQVKIEKPDEADSKNLGINLETPKLDSQLAPADSTPQTPIPQAANVESKQAIINSYTIQVGAFSTLTNAEKQKIYFEELGYQAEITNKVRSGKSLFLVWVGAYPNAQEAVKVSYDIKKKFNIESMIVQRY